MIYNDEMRDAESLVRWLRMYQKKNRNVRTIKAIKNARKRWRKSV